MQGYSDQKFVGTEAAGHKKVADGTNERTSVLDVAQSPPLETMEW